MTDRFDEMADKLSDAMLHAEISNVVPGDHETIGRRHRWLLSTALRAVDAEAEKRGNKAGQEAMRQKIGAIASGYASDTVDSFMEQVCALPIEEPTP